MFFFVLSLLASTTFAAQPNCGDHLESFSTVEALVRELGANPKSEKAYEVLSRVEFVVDFAKLGLSKSLKAVYFESDGEDLIRLGFRAHSRLEAIRVLRELDPKLIAYTHGQFGRVGGDEADSVKLAGAWFPELGSTRNQKIHLGRGDQNFINSIDRKDGGFYFYFFEYGSSRRLFGFLQGLAMRQQVRVRSEGKPLASAERDQKVFAPYQPMQLADFARISISDIRFAHELPISPTISTRTENENEFHGTGFHYLLSGTFRGHDVFVKFPKRKRIVEQVQLYSFLSDADLGPKFYGLTHDKDDKEGIVLEFVSGVHFTPKTHFIPPSIKVTMNTYRQLERLKLTLERIGLVYGGDPQIRIRNDGKVFLIDPEMLQFENEFVSSESTEISASDLMGPIHGINTMLENLKAILVSRELWRP